MIAEKVASISEAAFPKNESASVINGLHLRHYESAS